MNNNDEPPDYARPDRFLRIWQVSQRIGLSKTKIYGMQAEGTFPHSFPIAGRAVAWREADVIDWMGDRISPG
jgi:prophage regulatory protein